MQLADAIDAIPVVANAAERAVRFASPVKDQRVHNLASGAIERWNGSWVTDFQGAGSIFVNATAAPYNVIGDGVADTTAGLVAAIAAVFAAGGGVVYLPAGIYMKAAELALPSKVVLRGAGTESTVIKNSVANVGGIAPASVSRRCGIEDLQILAKTGDTTNIGLSFNTTGGCAHGRFRNVLISGFMYGVNGGDELWECEFDNVRSDSAASRSFRFIGSLGTGSDNLLKKCYANNVGNGGATGKSFEISACMIKSVMLNCTIGDTSSTEDQVVIGTNVFGLEIIGGNVEGFTLASGAYAFNVGSGSVVSIRGIVFQTINGPGAGSAALIYAQDQAKVIVEGVVQMTSPTGTLYSLRVGGSSSAQILYRSCTFVSAIDTTIPSGPQITRVDGKMLAMTAVAIDLSGGAATRVVVNLPSNFGRFESAKLIFTEASSADAGVLVKLGYGSDDDFLASVTSAISQALWAVQSMTVLDRRMGAWGGPVLLSCAGGKVGTGEVIVVLEYTVAQ